MLITIDGGAGVGKSTTAKMLAKRLGFPYVDTGLFYRAIAYYLDSQNVMVDITSEKEIVKSLSRASIVMFEVGKVVINKHAIPDEALRTERVSKLASDFSKLKIVRDHVLTLIKKIKQGLENSIFEGRDMGSVVFPDADLKFFFGTNLIVKAKRRLNDLIYEKGIMEVKLSIGDLEKEFEARDKQDREREFAPLQISTGSIVIDTTVPRQEEVVNYMCYLIYKRLIKQSYFGYKINE